MVVLAIPKYIRIASACSRESKYADPRTGSDVNEKTCSRRGGWIAGAASRPRHSGPDTQAQTGELQLLLLASLTPIGYRWRRITCSELF